ncbi:MAG: ABC transporter ATP-binding protein [Deltaproteobacteria bacterium]|nr:ABC transporter ATP-binding protein [Deltaproteobacteria bacterium]
MSGVPAVAVSHLSKYFPLLSLRRLVTGRWREGVWALHRVDFELEAGECLFLLGPNGSGKTTLVKLIATLLAPSSGRIRIQGLNADRAPLEVRRRLGFITCNESSFYGRLSGWNNLAFFARLHNLEPRRAIPPLAESLKLTPYLERRFFTYSTGIKRRFDIARGLLHRPDILLLDEPTTNLDPISAGEVRDLLLELRQQGKTMIVVTHRLEEVDRLGGRLAMVKEGRFKEMSRRAGENLEDLYRRAVAEWDHEAP